MRVRSSTLIDLHDSLDMPRLSLIPLYGGDGYTGPKERAPAAIPLRFRLEWRDGNITLDNIGGDVIARIAMTYLDALDPEAAAFLIINDLGPANAQDIADEIVGELHRRSIAPTQPA